MAEESMVPIVYLARKNIQPECGHRPPGQDPNGSGKPPGDTIIHVQVLVRDYGSRDAEPPQGKREPWELFFTSDPDEVRLVEAYFVSHGIEALTQDEGLSSRLLKGPLRAFEKAFGIEFLLDETKGEIFYTGYLKSAPKVSPLIIGVVGLCQKILVNNIKHVGLGVSNTDGAYSYQQLRDYYHFPEDAQGEGETIAILTLGGGYYPKDIEATLEMYNVKLAHPITYKGLNVPCKMDNYQLWLNYWKLPVDGNYEPCKDVTTVDWTYETTMDLATVACLAPKAKIYLLNLGIIPSRAIDNLIKYIREIKPTVIVGSIGLNEENNSFQDQFGRVLMEFNAVGGTSIFSAGNYGSNGGEDELVVNFPSTCPWVIAAGGSTMQPANSAQPYRRIWYTDFADRTYMSGCGGVSTMFTTTPPWQAPYKAAYSEDAALKLKDGRVLPDASMLSDNSVGPRFIAANRLVTSGGTSLSAQISAAFFACIRQTLLKRGVCVSDLNRRIYAEGAAKTFKGVTHPGSNWLPCEAKEVGPYTCAPNQAWNPCVGLGIPDGKTLTEALAKDGFKPKIDGQFLAESYHNVEDKGGHSE